MIPMCSLPFVLTVGVKFGIQVLTVDQVQDRVPDRVQDPVQDPAPGLVPDRVQDPVQDPAPGLVPDQALVVDRARCSLRAPWPERHLRSAAVPLQLESSLLGLLS